MKLRVAVVKCISRILSVTFRLLQLIMKMMTYVGCGSQGEAVPPVQDIILLESAVEIARRIREREITSEAVVLASIERLKLVNPIVNCTSDERYVDALHEARLIDAMIAKGLSESGKPFLGVPMTMKNSIAVKGMLQTVGLWSRRDSRATKDADVVKKLKAAGAIVIASTNTSELCLWWDTYNKVSGRTKNPYDTNYAAGGSSGGEAVALSCAGAPAGLGSDLGGSIRIPACFSGIFGHKPTAQTVPLRGHHPLALEEFLSIGPMAKRATDLLPILKVIVHAEQLERLRLNDAVDLTKLHYYFMEDDIGSFGVSPVAPSVRRAIGDVVQHFRQVLRVEVQRVSLRNMRHSALLWLTAMVAGRSEPFVAKELDVGGGPWPIWQELLKLCVGQSRHTAPALVSALLESQAVTLNLIDPTYTQHALHKCSQLATEIEDLLQDNGVLFCPTYPSEVPHHAEPISKPVDFSYAAIFNILGCPATHCPIGLSDKGLPVGVQVVAARYQDRLTIAVTEEIEQAFKGWVPH